VEPAFGDVKNLGQRKDEEILRQTEKRVRDAAEGQGIEPLDGEDISFEVKKPSERVEDLEGLENYLQGARGLTSGHIIL
jgi:hypothetical protein